jgi:hypothetical protein
MAKHEGKADVHVDAATFVKKEVCEMQVKMINQGVAVVKESVDKLEQTFAAGVADLKQTIERIHGPH